MDDSILSNVKKLLGVQESVTVFDTDITIHINAAFSSLNQLGVGPAEGFRIDDKNAKWSTLALSVNQLSLVKDYIYLKTRMLFDPPSTSFVIDAFTKQLDEIEWRISLNREMVERPYHEEVS